MKESEKSSIVMFVLGIVITLFFVGGYAFITSESKTQNTINDCLSKMTNPNPCEKNKCTEAGAGYVSIESRFDCINYRLEILEDGRQETFNFNLTTSKYPEEINWTPIDWNNITDWYRKCNTCWVYVGGKDGRD